MITSAFKLRVAAVVAVLGSALLHVGAMAIAPEFTEEIRVQGSAEQPAALGNDFADLVKAGDDIDPTETDSAEMTEPTETPPLEPVKTQPDTAQPVEPIPDTAQPVTPQSYASVSTPDFKIEPSQFEGLIPPSRVEKIEAVKPVEPTAQPSPEQAERVEPKVAETVIEPIEPVETVTSVEPLKNIPTPVAKPKQKKVEKPKKPKKPSAGKRTAKSTVNNKAGSQNGKKNAKASTSGKSKTKSRSSNSGNAAASNYPGKVYSKIARTRQRNAGGRGVTQVRFNVSSNGQAVSVSVARSSGNAKIDSAAVAHVKRASPFPKPPPGARTRFVIPIEFRR